MSGLKSRIDGDVKEAMKSKNEFKRDTLRLLLSAMKQVEVDKRVELSDDDIIGIIQKQIKQREDSKLQYENANRDDLAQKEAKEIVILKDYLPKQLDDNELKSEVATIIKEVGASSIKDVGKVMGIASKRLLGRADNRRINILAKEILTS